MLLLALHVCLMRKGRLLRGAGGTENGQEGGRRTRRARQQNAKHECKAPSTVTGNHRNTAQRHITQHRNTAQRHITQHTKHKSTQHTSAHQVQVLEPPVERQPLQLLGVARRVHARRPAPAAQPPERRDVRRGPARVDHDHVCVWLCGLWMWMCICAGGDGRGRRRRYMQSFQCTAPPKKRSHTPTHT